MFHHGVMIELSRLKWENELYLQEIQKYQSALQSIHSVIPFIHTNPDAVKQTLDVVFKAVAG